MRIYGDPKHKLGVFYWRSEADFGRRMAVVAVLVAPASSSLERPHGAQKNPKLVLGAFVGLEVRSGFEPL